MNTLEQRRRKNTRKILDEKGMTPGDFGRIIDRKPSYVSQLLSDTSPCRFGEKIARHIENCMKLQAGVLDNSDQKLDLKTLHFVINKVEAALNKRNLILNSNDKTQLIGYLYELKTSNDAPTDYQVRKIINDYIN